MAGELLATWAFETNREGADTAPERDASDDSSQLSFSAPDTDGMPLTEETIDAMSLELDHICPLRRSCPHRPPSLITGVGTRS
jgi:hypothetical protein